MVRMWLGKKGSWKEQTEVSSHPTTVEAKLSNNQRGKLDIQALCFSGVKHGLLVWLQMGLSVELHPVSQPQLLLAILDKLLASFGCTDHTILGAQADKTQGICGRLTWGLPKVCGGPGGQSSRGYTEIGFIYSSEDFIYSSKGFKYSSGI